MAKVDWITWKTNPKEILDPEKVMDKVEEFYNNFESYLTPMIYEQLKKEMVSGGLAKDAFNVSGISPANEMANDILRKIEEMKEKMDHFLKEVKQAAYEQKEIEKEQLIQVIEEKIAKEKEKLNESAASSDEPIIDRNGEERTVIIDRNGAERSVTVDRNGEERQELIQDNIRKLTTRLDQAKSL